MTATDVLRRLLDERGVEWTAPNSILRDTMTCWTAGGFYYEAFEVPEPDGTFLLTAAHQDDLTPEQAIAATLGSCNCSNNCTNDCTNSERTETCKQEEHGWSTEGDHARVWLTCGHDCMVETVADLPNFCPFCGAKVVGE